MKFRRITPGILLRSNSSEAHAKLSTLQRERRCSEGFNTDIVHEFNIGYKEMIKAGVNPKDAKKSIREAYRYSESLGGF
ncbi:hypothetical protein [Clostridium gasigenes]|uniref:hypothetical protein n=1 Tax=Clostridium gasigenes TaxID=94869 RepID=UPI001C0CAD12|nr:hypothetical protein [Clostridium gasigenes]